MPLQQRGLLDSKTCWFVPWKELSNLDNVENPDYGKLRKTDSEFSESDTFLEAGSPFTISLETFSIQGSHDNSGTNDLLVRTFVRYGDEPKTETINFFGMGVSAESFVENLEYEHVFSRQDFSENARVWIALEILEVDKGLEKESISAGLGKMRARFGAIFPALIPFATVAGVAVNAISGLQTLRKSASQNKKILSSQLDLYAKAVSGGDAPLRCGAYVFFNEELQGVQYRLGSGFKLKRAAEKDKNVPILHDYAVIKITKGFINSGKDPKEILKHQELAKVLSQEDEGASEEQRSAHFDFLAQLVENANKIKDIDYYRQVTMAAKSFDRQPTPAQQDRLVEIKTRLGQYISD
ncbi:MAG: hypothetical protein WA885_05095 [Phormidesmis sp.]